MANGGFLSRSDFACAGWDTVSQAGKIAPGIITNFSSENNNIAQQQIKKAISQGRMEIEFALPNILSGTIKEIYQLNKVIIFSRSLF